MSTGGVENVRRGDHGEPRVLLVTPQPFFEDRGTPIAIRMVARALCETGYAVDILSFPLGRPVDVPGATLFRCGNPFSINSVRIGFSLQKMLLDASLMRSFAGLLDTYNYDVVHAVEEAAYMAAVLCPRRGIPFIFDMASVIPEELAKRRLLRACGADRIAASMEEAVLERTAHVVCSMGLAAHVRSRHRHVPVSEWKFPALNERVGTDAAARLRAQLGISPSDCVVLYTGNFASYQGVPLLAEAFEIASAQRPDLLLVCVGASENERDSMEGAMPARTTSRTRIVLRRRRREMPAYLAVADILVSPRTATGNVPLKIFDYLATGRPIVATRGKGHEPLLNTSRAILCDPDPQSFARGLLEAVNSPDRADEVRRNALCYSAEHLSWRAFSDSLNRVYAAAVPAAQIARLASAA